MWEVSGQLNPRPPALHSFSATHTYSAGVVYPGCENTGSAIEKSNRENLLYECKLGNKLAGICMFLAVVVEWTGRKSTGSGYGGEVDRVDQWTWSYSEQGVGVEEYRLTGVAAGWTGRRTGGKEEQVWRYGEKGGRVDMDEK